MPLLSDSNRLKEQYIARFFDLCSLYIDKMDSYRKTLNRLAQNRQSTNVFKRLKSTSMMENELDELYKNFDAIFLNLYPTFVADFNSLLIPRGADRAPPGRPAQQGAAHLRAAASGHLRQRKDRCLPALLAQHGI